MRHVTTTLRWEDGELRPLDDVLEREDVTVDAIRTVSPGPEGRHVELTAFGTSRAIRRAAASLPDGVRLEIERIGEYEPDAGLSRTLTDRQAELFELAFGEGYYEVPRRTTHRELAATLGLSTGTVSERLQRIESKLAAAYAEPG